MCLCFHFMDTIHTNTHTEFKYQKIIETKWHDSKLLNYCGTKAYGTTIIYANYCCARFVTASHTCFLLFLRLLVCSFVLLRSFHSFRVLVSFLFLWFLIFFFIRFGYCSCGFYFRNGGGSGGLFIIRLWYFCVLLLSSSFDFGSFQFSMLLKQRFFPQLLRIVGAQRLLQLCYVWITIRSQELFLLFRFVGLLRSCQKLFFCFIERFQKWLNENEWWIFFLCCHIRSIYVHLSIYCVCVFRRCHHHQQQQQTLLFVAGVTVNFVDVV